MNKVPLLPFTPPDDDALPFEVKRIKTLPKSALEPQPHRHTFHVIFLVTGGSGMHYLDFVGDEVRPNSIHLVGPGQIHYWDVAERPEGYVILFEPSMLLDRADQHLLAQLSFFRTINGVSAVYPTAEQIGWFIDMARQLERDYQQREFARSLSIMSGVRLFLIAAQRLAAEREPWPGGISAEKQLASRYTDLVEQHAIEEHRVDWYAQELAVTAAHLSKSVKNALGMTAGTLLRQRLVLEAKRLLVHTDDTAATIADQLNFEDASYFGRFFKRETNLTPRQFRTDFSARTKR